MTQSWRDLQLLPAGVAAELGAALFQQVPGFAVGLVVVLTRMAAVVFWEAVGVDRDGVFGGGFEDHAAGDDVPGLGGDDVEGEEVEVGGAVALESVDAVTETAEIACAFAGGEAFDLDADEAAEVVEGDVVRSGVSPGGEDAESVEIGGGHEEQLDPLAALFERLESFPIVFVFHRCTPRVLSKKALTRFRKSRFLDFAKLPKRRAISLRSE